MNSVETTMGIGGLFIMFTVAAIAFLGFVFWVWMLIHAIKNRGLSDTERIVWVLVIIFVSFLGAVIYFFVGKPREAGT